MTHEQKEDLFAALQEAGEKLAGAHLTIDVTTRLCDDGNYHPSLRLIFFTGTGDHTIFQHHEPTHDLFAVTAAQAFEQALPSLAATIRRHTAQVCKTNKIP